MWFNKLVGFVNLIIAVLGPCWLGGMTFCQDDKCDFWATGFCWFTICFKIGLRL